MITDSLTRWLRVWWHSLWRTFSKEPHRMCHLTYTYFGRVDFCECGYPDLPYKGFVNRMNEEFAKQDAALSRAQRGEP